MAYSIELLKRWKQILELWGDSMKNIKVLFLILFFSSYFDVKNGYLNCSMQQVYDSLNRVNQSSLFSKDLSNGVEDKDIEQLEDFIKKFVKEISHIYYGYDPYFIEIEGTMPLIPKTFKEKINLLAQSKNKTSREFTALYNKTFKELFEIWFQSKENIWNLAVNNLRTSVINDLEFFICLFAVTIPLFPILIIPTMVKYYSIISPYGELSGPYAELGKKLLEKIDRDFAKYTISYSKKEMMDYLNAASKDMFLFEVQTSKDLGRTVKTEVGNLKNINFPTQKEIDELKDEAKKSSKLSTQEFQNWVSNNKALTNKLITFNRWMKVLSDLREFLVKSGSKDLPPIFNEVLALNDDILDKIVLLRDASNKGGADVLIKNNIKLLKEKLLKIQKKIDSVYVFRQGPKDAKELLQILVGVPGKDKRIFGIFDRVIDKMETDFGPSK